MKRNRLLSLIVLSIISLTVLQSNSGGYDTDIRATSATPGCSGTGCHSTTGNNSNNSLKVELFDANNVSVLKYDDNTTYTVKISLAKNNVQAPLTAGFQATFFNSTNNHVGSFPGIGSNAQVKETAVGGIKIVTHKIGNVTNIVSGSTVEWTFQWKSPLLGANDIIISVLGNDANSSSTSAGDLVYHTTLFLPKNATAVKDYSKGIDAIYPNPSKGQLNINLESAKASEIAIYSITGQLVKQVNGQGNKINMDVSELNNGNYIITVAQDGNFARQQFVKH